MSSDPDVDNKRTVMMVESNNMDTVCNTGNMAAIHTDTDSFLTFFNEAANSVMDDGTPLLMVGDVVVVDNTPTHYNRGGELLTQFLDHMGIQYIFTPTYSPDFNAAEYVFGHLKTLFKKTDI